MFEMAHLHEDSLREYDELELCYLETGTTNAYSGYQLQFYDDYWPLMFLVKFKCSSTIFFN